MAKNKKVIKVGYDIDDTMMSFNEPFMKWTTDKYGIDFSKPRANGFLYNDRHHDLDVEWSELVDEFTIHSSVEMMQPEPGLLEHLEEFSSITDTFIITSRPAAHRRVTEQLISKYLSDYFHNLDKDLIMPDQLRVDNIRPTKASICTAREAIMFFEDAFHNYEDFLNPDIKTRAIVYRTPTTIWNHEQLPAGVERVIELPSQLEVAEGWSEASEFLRNEIARN